MFEFKPMMEKIRSLVRGAFGPTSFSGTGESTLQYDSKGRALGKDNLPLDMSQVNPKEYAELGTPTPARGIPQGGFKQSVMDYYNDIKPNLTFDYSDKPSFPENLMPYVAESSMNYELDPNVLMSLIASESGGAGYYPDLIGGVGEVGLGQITPELFYSRAGFQNPEEYRQALMDPAFNIDQAASILSDLLREYEGNYYDALASYNAGSGGYQESGYGRQYAEDTLRRINLLDQYLNQSGALANY